MKSLLIGVALVQQICSASQAATAKIEQRFKEEDWIELNGDSRRRQGGGYPKNEEYVRVPFRKFSPAAGDYIKIVENAEACSDVCYNEWAADQTWVLEDMFYVFTDASGDGQCTCRVAFTHLNGQRTDRNEALNQAEIQLFMDESEGYSILGCKGGPYFAGCCGEVPDPEPSNGRAQPCGALRSESACMFNSECTWLTIGGRSKCFPSAIVPPVLPGRSAPGRQAVSRKAKSSSPKKSSPKRRPRKGRRRLQGDDSPDERVEACCGGGGGGW